MSKVKFTFSDGPMKDCVPANGVSVDASLVGMDPVAGDKRFTMTWDRSRVGKGIVQGVYKFVRQEDGQVVGLHVPDVVQPVEGPSNG